LKAKINLHLQQSQISTTDHRVIVGIINPALIKVSTMAASTSIASDPSILASRRTVYVGCLADEVTPQLLRATMIPFGNIKSLDIPMNYAAGVHKGFG
jgi:RNA recognition motif-containing protein